MTSAHTVPCSTTVRHSRRRCSTALQQRCLTATHVHARATSPSEVSTPRDSSSAGSASATKQKAVVVGAGVGGLAMSARLGKAGYEVTLVEKNAGVGGRMQSFSPDQASGWRFDTGPSLLLFPDKYRECFAALGEDMEDHVNILRVSPAYRAHFGDGTSFDLSYDMGELKAQLEAIEPGAGGMFFDWLGRARSSLDLGVKAFIERDSTSALDFLNPGLVLPLALKVNALDLLLSQHRQMSGYFKSEKLRSLFSFQELYVGLSPYNAPGVFSLLAATELTDGVWYPKGGFGTVRDALQSIGQKLGVKLRTSTAVTQLITQEDAPPASVDGDTAAAPKRRVVGVRLDSGEVLPADVVVANPDLPWVFQHLLSESGPAYEAEAKRVDAMDYSASVIAYNFAMKKPLRKLLHHNVFLSSDYKGSWERPTCPQDLAAPRQLNFYVHNPCVTDPSSAPEGSASVMVLLPVANLQEQQAAATAAGRPMPDVDAMIAAGRDAIFRRWIADGVADADVATNVEHEFVITPQEWGTRYNITHGAVFGLAHGLTQLACFRPPTRTGLPGWPETPSTQGLYFVGASTRPGNGVPLVMMGVKVVFENIMREARRVAV